MAIRRLNMAIQGQNMAKNATTKLFDAGVPQHPYTVLNGSLDITCISMIHSYSS